MTAACDCLVIGGGLIGLLTARELAISGATVTVLERGETGRESSWAGGGILSPLYPWRYPAPVTRLAQYSQVRYAEFARVLAEETGIDPEWTPSGLLILDMEEVVQARQWAGQWAVSLERLEGDRLRACERALGMDFAEGLWMPGVAQVRNPRLLKALKASLLARGVTIHEGTAVRGLTLQDGVVTGADTERGRFQAARIVLAGGAWSGELLSRLGQALAVRPVRGQMILFRATADLLKRMALFRGRYVIPRRDGRILAGSTLEDVGFDKSTTTEALDALRQAAIELVPELAGCEIEAHWAGLRPGSPEGIPFIGEHPDIRGLFVNTGHFRNGVVLGLASAQLAADLILGRQPALDPAPYGLAAARS